MSDRLHDHLTLGFRRGCLACAQLEADMARARTAVAHTAAASGPRR